MDILFGEEGVSRGKGIPALLYEEALMASKTVRREPEGFDVVCTIGRVEFDSLSDLSPTDAAFLLIARHDSDGVFTFPTPDGGSLSVTVDTTPPAGRFSLTDDNLL